MRIGVDCDEVIFPLLSHHCIFLNKKYGLNLDWRNFSSYNFWEHYGRTRDEAVKDFEEFTSTEEFIKVQPIEGSQQGIRGLAKMGELYLITSRTDKIGEKTQEWLDRHFQGLFSKLVFGNTFSNGEYKKTAKREFCRDNGIKMLLEDHYEYALEVARNIPVILFEKPWNNKYAKENKENITRVKNWEQAVKVARFIY